MKKYSTKSILAALFGVAFAMFFSIQAFAATPSLSLVNNGYTTQVTVYADPNAPVILDYYLSGQIQGAGIIGYTNYSGTFSSQITPTNYPIPNGAQTVVMVDGQQSNPVIWQSNGNGYNPYPPQYPNNGYTNYTNGAISLGQTSASLTVGQTQSIYITQTYNGGNYPIVNQYYVSNPSTGIVSATISGNTLTLYGQSQGVANVSVCSGAGSGIGYGGGNCASVYVTVTGSYYNNPTPYPCPPTVYNTPITVSNSNVQLTVGATSTVTLYGGNNNYNNGYNNYSNSFYISGNNNSIVSATVSGNSLVIYGINPGTATLTVCQSGGSQCATIYVTVSPQYYYQNTQYYPSNYQYSGYNGQNNNGWYYSSTNHCYQQYR